MAGKKEKMGKLISQSAFARSIGKSQQYIAKLIKQGKLILHDGKLDYDEANAFLRANARPANELGAKFNKEQKGKGAKKAAMDRTQSDVDPEMKSTSKAMQKARLLAEINSAKIKEIEYKKAVGELLPVDLVVEENAKIAEVVRAKLLSIPNRAAPRIASLKTASEIQDLLSGIVNEILQEFQDLAKNAESNYKNN